MKNLLKYSLLMITGSLCVLTLQSREHPKPTSYYKNNPEAIANCKKSCAADGRTIDASGSIMERASKDSYLSQCNWGCEQGIMGSERYSYSEKK